MPAAIAAMRTRLVLEAPAGTPDGAGGEIRTYLPRGLIWAAVTRVGTDEIRDDDRAAQAIRWRIETRFRADLDAGMRLRLGARLFDITGIADPDGRRRRLVIDAVETAP